MLQDILQDILVELKATVSNITVNDVDAWSIDNGDLILDIPKYGKRIRISDIEIEEET